MFSVTLDDKERSIVVIRNALGDVIAVFVEIHPGQTMEVSMALDEVNKTNELQLYMKKFGIKHGHQNVESVFNDRRSGDSLGDLSG